MGHVLSAIWLTFQFYAKTAYCGAFTCEKSVIVIQDHPIPTASPIPSVQSKPIIKNAIIPTSTPVPVTKNPTNTPTSNSYSEVSLCAYTNGDYSYNFGYITASECLTKSDQYFRDRTAKLTLPDTSDAIKKMQEISTQPIVTQVIDATVHTEITPTPEVPFGFGN